MDEKNKLFLLSSEKGLKQAFVQFWKNYYLQKIANCEMDTMIVGLQKLREEMREKEDAKCTDWTLITINPYLHVTMKELEAVVLKVVSKKWITTYCYTYEQRAETSEDYKGFHCHLLIYRKDKSNSTLIREIRNTCKNICDTSNTHILNFRNLKTDDDVRKAYNYITGEKADENKHIKQMIDKEFRIHYKLKPFYISDENKILYNIINNGVSTQKTLPEEETNLSQTECEETTSSNTT